MARLIEMRKGRSPQESLVKENDNEAVLKALEKVWKGEIDGIMVMRQ